MADGKNDSEIYDSQIGAWLISVHSVDTGNSSFGATFRLIYRFYHPDLASVNAFSKAGNRTYYHPNDVEQYLPGQAAEIQNNISAEIVRTKLYNNASGESGLVFHLEDDDENALVLEVVYSGIFKQVFDLKQFPFEDSVLKINFVLWRATEIDYHRKWQVVDKESLVPQEEPVDLPDFHIDKYQLAYEKSTKRATLAIALRRRPWFYTIASTLSMAIIALFSLTTFGIPFTNVGDRISITGSLLLASIAVKFVISADTPRVPYTTAIDREIIIVFLYLLGLAGTHTLVKSEAANSLAFSISAGAVGLILISMCVPLVKYSTRSAYIGLREWWVSRKKK